MEFTDAELIQRVNELYRDLEIYELKRKGKPVTEDAINSFRRRRTVSLTEPARRVNGRVVHIINTNNPTHYRILQQNPHLLKPHEVLGSRNTYVYGPLPTDEEKAAAKVAGRRPTRPSQLIHAEQLGANDGVRLGSENGRIATSNDGCTKLCQPLLKEEFPGYRHVNPVGGGATSPAQTRASLSSAQKPPQIPRTAGQPPFASIEPKSATQSGEIRGAGDSNSAESRGTDSNGTGGGSRGLTPKTWSAETQKRPSSASQSQRPNASSTRSAIKGKVLDLEKIRGSAVKAIKPRIGTAKNLAKSVGKGLVIGYVVGLLESYLFNKLAGWLLKDEGVKRLNALEKRKGQEIERRVQKAIEDHVKKLPRRSGRKIVLEFRLVNKFAIGSIYLPHDLLIDKVSVTEFFWARKEECVEAEVTPDVTEVTVVGDGKPFRKGAVLTLHQAKDLFQVLKCTRILDFDYPDVGEPPLEGEWRSFFMDKDGPDKQHLATYTITFSGAKPKISGINATDNKKLRIWDEEWTGTFLKFKVKQGKYTEHIRVSFDEWDTLTGWSDLYEGYSRMQPSSPEQWERITEEEKQFVEIIRKGAAYLRVN
jgi:hypothetical protein